VAWRGSDALLRLHKVAVFCSRSCPPGRALATVDWIRSLAATRTALVGGFHSPAERDCLAIALAHRLPVIVCVARHLDTMRVAGEWRKAIDDERMLLLSRCPGSARRLTEARSHERNRFVAALADEILVVHAAPGSHTERLVRFARGQGKRIVTLD
jgi:predicted Rossmann fold nucleotide-binding protein DprA/Smf involved in DNA uptake